MTRDAATGTTSRIHCRLRRSAWLPVGRLCVTFDVHGQRPCLVHITVAVGMDLLSLYKRAALPVTFWAPG